MSLLEDEDPQVAEWFFHKDLHFTGWLDKPVAVILTVVMVWVYTQSESFTHPSCVPEHAV